MENRLVKKYNVRQTDAAYPKFDEQNKNLEKTSNHQENEPKERENLKKSVAQEIAEVKKGKFDVNKLKDVFEKLSSISQSFVNSILKIFGGNPETLDQGTPSQAVSQGWGAVRENLRGTNVNIDKYIENAQTAKPIENCQLDFDRYAPYGFDKGDRKCAKFASAVLGFNEGSVYKLFPRLIAGINRTGKSVEAVTKLSQMRDGQIYALGFLSRGRRNKGGEKLTHIALAAITTFPNGARGMVAADEGRKGGKMTVNILSGKKPSEQEIRSHLAKSPDQFLNKIGRWANASNAVHREIIVYNNKAGYYWSDNYDKTGKENAFQFALNITDLIA